MKILQLCKKFPYPLKDGESIAVTYLSKALHELGHEVTLLSMNTTKHRADISNLPPDYNHYQNIYCTDLDNTLNIKDAFLNLFSTESYHVSRFICEKFESKLVELLSEQSFDVIQLETLYLAPYIPVIKQYSDALVSMRAHNVEYEIWERITSNTTFWPKRWYLRHLTQKLRKYELDHLNDYDYLVAVSERDLRKFKELGYKNGAMASPIGLDVGKYITIPSKKVESKKIGFIGALDWMPSREGLNWFIEEVWPSIYKEDSSIEFHVAGRNTPPDIQAIDLPNIFIHGEVPDAIQFMNDNAIMVVPLFSGSGMRVKILEGMALGKTIVTTTLGKEGIEVEKGSELIVADDASSFSKEILALVKDESRLSDIGKQAKAFIKAKYDHKSIAIELINKYQSLLDNPYPKKEVVH